MPESRTNRPELTSSAVHIPACGSVFEYTFTDATSNPPKQVTMETGQYRCQRAAQSLLGATVASFPTGMRYATASYYKSILYNFLEYLDETDFATEAPLSELPGNILTSWEEVLRTRLNSWSVYKYLSFITTILKTYESEHPVKECMKNRLTEVAVGGKGKSTPVSALPESVEAQIITAVEKEVSALVRRKPQGVAALDLSAQAQTALRHLLNNERPPTSTRSRTLGVTLTELYHSIYPSRQEIEALVLRFAFLTGWEPTSIEALQASSIGKSDGRYLQVHHQKYRRHGNPVTTVRLEDGDLGTPGGVLRYAMVLTEKARSHAATDSLWVYWQPFEKRLIPLSLSTGLNGWSTFVTRNNIVSSSGTLANFSLLQVRKTFKMRRYTDLGGDFGMFVDGHTPNIAAKHYAALPELTEKHQQAVLGGIQTLLSYDEPSEDVQQTWLSGCKDVNDSPFSPAGTACQALPWLCFFCPNAVISERNLPSIVAFHQAASSLRAEMDAEDWSGRFEKAVKLVETDILPAFSPELLAVAEGIAATHPVKDLVVAMGYGDLA